MAWTHDWSSGDQDWHSVANVTDFQKAVNERFQANGVGDVITPKGAGDDVQDYEWIYDLQSRIVSSLVDFNWVVSHDAGVPRAAGYYDGETTIEQYADLAAVFSAAGLGTATWRAYTTHPDDAGADLSELHKAGNIIGPWLFEDLQAVLNVLVWTTIGYWPATYHSAWDRQGENNRRNGVGHGDTRAASETDTEAEYDAAAADTLSAPYCESLMGTPGVDWRGELERAYSYGKAITAVAGGISRSVDFYAIGEAVTNWDRNGDWPAAYTPDTSELYYFDSTGPTTDSTVYSAAFGTNAVSAYPNWGANADVSYGYHAAYVKAVIRWNVTGGFEYQ